MPTTTEREKIRLSLDVSPELYHLLESIAERTDESKSDVLRKAIVLMDVAVRASQEGKRLLIGEPTGQGERTVTEIVGLFPPRAAHAPVNWDSPVNNSLKSKNELEAITHWEGDLPEGEKRSTDRPDPAGYGFGYGWQGGFVRNRRPETPSPTSHTEPPDEETQTPAPSEDTSNVSNHRNIDRRD